MSLPFYYVPGTFFVDNHMFFDMWKTGDRCSVASAGNAVPIFVTTLRMIIREIRALSLFAVGPDLYTSGTSVYRRGKALSTVFFFVYLAIILYLLSLYKKHAESDDDSLQITCLPLAKKKQLRAGCTLSRTR